MPEKKIEKYTCVAEPEYHYDLPLSEFFSVSGKGMYGKLGHLPICKHCFEHIYNEYNAELHSPHLAMRRMCMTFDLYYNGELFEKTGGELSQYFKKLNLRQNQRKNFDDSIEEGQSGAVIGEMVGYKAYSDDDGELIEDNSVEKWGYGLKKIDYDTLDQHYAFLKNANPNCDSNQEIFIVDLCYIKMQQARAIRSGKSDDYIKLTESYRKTFQQAGLKTVKDSSTDESFTIGVTAATIEKYTPAEYYKNRGLFKDYDELGEYIERFMTRPLRNLQHGTNDRDKEFFVKEDEARVSEYDDDE